MTTDPFFHAQAGAFHPTDIARGPWNRESLHGRVIAGLLARCIEEEHGDPDFVANRLTVDMFRLAPFAPLRVTVTPVRLGGRIRVVDAAIDADGVEVARGRAVMLRRGEQPPGEVWSPPPWDVPAPESLPPTPGMGGEERPPMWDMRTIDHGFGSVARKRVWMREVRPLLDAEPLTPFVRIALAADFTSPLSHSGSSGLEYINSDITLYLQREPADEWIGFEVATHQATDGIAVGACNLYDLRGPVGLGITGALANRRPPASA